jgi:hypothetical protein
MDLFSAGEPSRRRSGLIGGLGGIVVPGSLAGVSSIGGMGAGIGSSGFGPSAGVAAGSGTGAGAGAGAGGSPRGVLSMRTSPSTLVVLVLLLYRCRGGRRR